MNKVLSTEEVLEAMLGIHTRPVDSPASSTVGTTATKLLRQNANRFSYVITNLGANPMYIGKSENVSSTSGLYIAPYGGQITVQWDKDFSYVTYEVWAISTGVANAYYTIENISN